MKYSEFLQLIEVLNEQTISIEDFLKNPNILMENKNLVNAVATALKNNGKVVTNQDQSIIAVVDANNKVVTGNISAENLRQASKLVNTNEIPTITTSITEVPKINAPLDAKIKLKEMPAERTDINKFISKETPKVNDMTKGEMGPPSDSSLTSSNEAPIVGDTNDVGVSSAALSKGFFSIISPQTLLLGVGVIGATAIVAWVLRRQIIKAVWVKKLKNNASIIGKQIDQILIKHIKPMLEQKDNMIKKEKSIDDQLKKTKDSNTQKRLNSLKSQLDKMQNDWEVKLVNMINESIDTIVNGKTQELYQRIDSIKQLQPGQKTSLKTIWSTMMINFKAEGWKNIINLKLITNEEIENKINNSIKAELDKNNKNTAIAKKKLEEKYKTLKDITIGKTNIKYGEWYLYEKAKVEDPKTLKGNKYVKFILDAKALADEGVEKYLAEIIEVGYNEKTEKMLKTVKGEFSSQEELEKIIQNAKIDSTTTTIDLDNFKKNMTQTNDQKQTAEEIAKK